MKTITNPAAMKIFTALLALIIIVIALLSNLLQGLLLMYGAITLSWYLLTKVFKVIKQ